MTEKELLYLEDVLQHSKQLEDVCNTLGSNASEGLKEALNQIITTAENQYTRVYNLL